MNVDPSQIQEMNVSGQNTAGTWFVVQGVLIPLILEDSEATALLSAYNASDASSPSEAICRQIARAVLDALSASRS